MKHSVKKISDDKNVLLNEVFLKMLSLQVFISFIFYISSLTDGIIISIFFPIKYLSMLALYAPIVRLTSMFFAISNSTQVIVCNYIGEGKKQKIQQYYSTFFFLFLFFAMIIGLSLFFFCNQIAVFLGARGGMIEDLSNYIKGKSFGIPFFICANVLQTSSYLSNTHKLTIVSLLTMICSNILLDLVLINVFSGHIMSIAIGTSIASCLYFVILYLAHYFDEYALKLNYKYIDISLIPKMLNTSLNKVAMSLANVFSTYNINIIFLSCITFSFMPIMTVKNYFMGLFASIFVGFNSTIVVLGGIFVGQKNKNRVKELYGITLQEGIFLAFIFSVLVLIFKKSIISFFIPKSNELFSYAETMINIMAFWIIPICTLIITMGMLHSINKSKICDVINIVKPLIEFVLVFVLIKIIPEHFWISYIISIFISFALIWALLCRDIKKISFDFNELCGFSKTEMKTLTSGNAIIKTKGFYGQKDIESLDISILNTNEVTQVAESICEYGKKHNIPEKKYYFAALCMEEMAANIVQYGFKHNKNRIDIHLTYDGENITIFLQDNCKLFNPIKYMQQFNVDKKNIEKNMGIRIVQKISKKMEYLNNIGINSLTIEI